ncbi:MAG TPA: sulfate ABC transporter substrate-binding protein [Pyrinomonadaceae bacterium]|nr:sulfate ABC transporter substrate-binding protein [Pyrinomonadaceae bacterium]
MRVLRFIRLSLAALVALTAFGCLPSSPGDSSQKQTITLYGFSIMKESMEKDIFPAFKAKWKAEHGTDVDFVASFAGSETVTNQILQGTPADVAILSIDRDAARLKEGGATTVDWHQWPQKGIVNKTPFVILVRKGNPQKIQDFADLGRPGIKVIHPDPVSSGGAQWSLLAIYGSELKKSEAETGQQDKVRALNTLKAIWANVISTPGSAREARTQFETGYGDALITYELEGLAMKQAGSEIEMVVPKSTIYSEHPVVLIDRNMSADKRAVTQAFIDYLWSDDAQKAFVKHYFRSATNDAFNQGKPEFAQIELPFTVDMFGGWDKAFPDVIQGIFQQQVQKR